MPSQVRPVVSCEIDAPDEPVFEHFECLWPVCDCPMGCVADMLNQEP